MQANLTGEFPASANRTLVQVAGTRLEMLECLLDAYLDISEMIPDLEEYTSLFRNYPKVLDVLQLYYEDILQFHLNALDVFGRPGKRETSNSGPIQHLTTR